MKRKSAPPPLALPLHTLYAGTLLLHVSRVGRRAQPLYFGANAANRYDAPDNSYGVLYLGEDLPTALMESMFHQHRWSVNKNRVVSSTEVNDRLVRVVQVTANLVLADVAAPNVMASQFGLTATQLVSRSYKHTQRISKQVHSIDAPSAVPQFDGIYYPSRNNFPARCVALFERSAKKVAVTLDIDLAMHLGWPAFVSDFQVAVV